MSLGPQIIPFGNIASSFVLTIALTPAATTNGVTAEQLFTVPGLLLGDQVSGITFLGAFSSLVDMVNYRVSANNQLAIAFSNNTAGSLTYPAGNFYVEVNRPSAGLAMSGIQ
jgi:hypothetical protein